ncbi:MAG: ABC transporter permease [Desulfobacteraceae bacterium]|nr:MAG: ABC transporter permease [Desulfobacteraceae bacterium]
MNLTSISVRNLLRRRGKATFILAGLVIGIATAVGIYTFVESVTEDINHKMEQYGANILIVPRTENLALTYGGISLGGVSFEMEEIRESDLAKVRTIRNASNIAALGPMVLGVVSVGDKRVMLAGVDFRSATILKPWWNVLGTYPEKSGVVLGAEAARVLNVGVVESSLELGGLNLPVAGVLQPTGSQDDHLIFARLSDAQQILGKTGRISMVEVAALCKDCPVDDMVKQIGDVLPGARVMAIQQVVKSRMEMLLQFKKFAYAVSAALLFTGGLVVLVTMMGSVRERTDEIGIFRAIGFRRTHIMRIIFLEAAIISGLAGILGTILGAASAGAAVALFGGGNGWHFPFSQMTAIGAVLLSLAVGLTASAYPAALASRMDPNEALRAL